MNPPGPLRRDGCPDMRYSCNRSWAASSGTSVPLTSGGVFSSVNTSSSSLRHSALVENAPQRLRADGNPDMRYKANKEYVAKHDLVVPTSTRKSSSSLASWKDPTPSKSTAAQYSSGMASNSTSGYSDTLFHFLHMPLANSTRCDEEPKIIHEKEEEKRLKQLMEERDRLEEENYRLNSTNRRLENERHYRSFAEAEQQRRSILEEEERRRSLLENQKKMAQAQEERNELARKIQELTIKLENLQAAEKAPSEKVSTFALASRTSQEPSSRGTAQISSSQKLSSSLPLEIATFQARMSSMELKAKEVSRMTIETITRNFKEAIGRGGFSQVFKGEWGGRHVAVKDLRCSLRGASKQFLKMIEAEMLALSRLEHPNIVGLLAYSIQSYEPDIISASLVFEYANGGTLFERLFTPGSTPLGIREIMLIALHTTEAIFALHKLDLVHRDVKSSNILLQVNGAQIIRAVLADFGLARFSSQLNDIDAALSSLTAVVGTPGYVDPEYAESNQVLPRIDVYAFGVVLFEMLWREKPETQLARRARRSTVEECAAKAKKQVSGIINADLIKLARRCVSLEDRPDAIEIVFFFRRY